jgi:hypothetical protein
MDNGSSNKDQVEDHVWTHGKAVSHLTSSDNSMSDQRKKLIKHALEYDIIDIRSYRGYKGDLLIEFTTMDKDAAKALQKIAEISGFEIEVHQNILSIYEIYCICPSESIYELK